MLNFLQNQILFYAALVFVLFLPGHFLLLAIFGKSKILSQLEKFIISFGLSIAVLDFILFAYSGLKISISRPSIIIGLLLFMAASFGIYRFRLRKNRLDYEESERTLFSFSRHQLALILLIIFLAFFIKTAFLSQTISPNATDLGHHMYWSKWMVENHRLPDYDGLPDFIVGEQTIFGTIGILSGLSFFSAFPPVILHLVNILGILTVFILTLRIFKKKNIAILSLLFVGVLYAVTAPQSKFVSGGVIGNILGNFLMPLAFYLYCRAFESIFSTPLLPPGEGARRADEGAESTNVEISASKIFLSLAIFVTFGLFYTHHLTALIFLFVFAFLVLFFLAANCKDIKIILSKVWKVFFSPPVLAIFIGGLIFFFFIFTPNYINPSAVNTAVGAPSKASREGLTIANLRTSIGEDRLGLGFFGLAILLFHLRKKRWDFGYLAVFSWGAIIFLLAFAPRLFFINLPSDRIGNYLSYPFSILSAYGIYAVFKNPALKNGKNQKPFGNSLVRLAFMIIFGFIFIKGISDSAEAIPIQNDYDGLVETFRSSAYLAERTNTDDGIIKDHNYIAGDSWIKLFFMRGYKYPLSRGYFKRYDDTTKPREMCTLYMISNPGGKDSEQCYSDTKTDFVMVNPRYDSVQFRKLNEFNQIYMSPEVAIYYKDK